MNFRNFLLWFLCFIVSSTVFAQKTEVFADSIPKGYFVTHSKTELLEKLTTLSIGIQKDDSISDIISKIEKFIISYQPQKQYPDDVYAKAAIIQTIEGFKLGGYGIGAVLVDKDGKIIIGNYNSQIQRHRSDLHAEMALLTAFEESPQSKDLMNVYVYKPGLIVYSSTEPCPMCFIRLASAGVITKYCSPGPDDGMASRIDCLPSAWRDLAHKYPCTKAQSSPILQKIAHLMFFSYLLDNRGPK